MIKDNNEQIINAMRDAVVQVVNPYQIVLFGSYATGRQTSASDIDLLVIEEGEFGVKKNRRKEAAKVWQALLPFDISKDVLVYSVDEVKTLRDTASHVVGQAMRYGKVIYERT